MLDVFDGTVTYFKVKKSVIDNATFRLHYRVTFGILLTCSLLATAHQFFGNPISCITDAPSTSQVETYCWIHGTYTMIDQINATIGTEVAHPGVGTNSPKYDPEAREKRHAYYQWVCFMFFIQAMLCYMPHYIWKSTEGGKLSMLVQGLDKETLVMADSTKDRRRAISDYFIRRLQTHNSYVYKFVFCEVLNLINVVGQVFLMDKFLGYQFTSYGMDVLSVSTTEIEERDDPMNRVFPKMTKCNFYFYGPSGSVQKFDSLCLLPINIINEKMYIFVWFWFVILITWTLIHLIFRFISLLSGYCRLMMLSNHARTVNRNDLEVILKKCDYGDWFILMQLGKNLNKEIFHDLLLDLRDKIDYKRADNTLDDDE
jgi:hypothetical protein